MELQLPEKWFTCGSIKVENKIVTWFYPSINGMLLIRKPFTKIKFFIRDLCSKERPTDDDSRHHLKPHSITFGLLATNDFNSTEWPMLRMRSYMIEHNLIDEADCRKDVLVTVFRANADNQIYLQITDTHGIKKQFQLVMPTSDPKIQYFPVLVFNGRIKVIEFM